MKYYSNNNDKVHFEADAQNNFTSDTFIIIT